MTARRLRPGGPRPDTVGDVDTAPSPTVTRVDTAPSPFARRLSRGQLIVFDCLAGAAVSLFLLTIAARSAAPEWARLALPLALGLPLAVRRLWPRTVFCVVLVPAVAAMALQVTAAAYVAPAYALYTVALTSRRGGRTPSQGVTGLAVAVVAGVAVAGTPAPSTGLFGGVMFGVAALVGAWTVGRAVGERRAYAAWTAERLARDAVVGERLRIARELHDVVAHSMGLIAIKAGVANHVVRTRPEEAHDALRVIETESRSALVEMRRLLGVLRADPAGPGPVPGIAGLPGLAERAGSAGVTVELDVRGADGLPEGVGLSVYRIVQEALTNVVKHAAPGHCRVAVEAVGGRGGRRVRIEVTDDGPGYGTPPSEGEGHGLIGMRERVMLYGGAFEAGPGPGRGFRVAACLPYEEKS